MAYENHWFPLIRPAIKSLNPYFLGGGTLGRGRLTSHDRTDAMKMTFALAAFYGEKGSAFHRGINSEVGSSKRSTVVSYKK